MSVKLEREAQEREEAMQQIREQEAKLNEAHARVSKEMLPALEFLDISASQSEIKQSFVYVLCLGSATWHNAMPHFRGMPSQSREKRLMTEESVWQELTHGVVLLYSMY